MGLKLKRNFCFDVNGRFSPTWCLTLPCTLIEPFVTHACAYIEYSRVIEKPTILLIHTLYFSDSFNTFREILDLALDRRVDFVLLGGDLFHDNKPSRNAERRCIEILREKVILDLYKIKFEKVASDRSQTSWEPKDSQVNVHWSPCMKYSSRSHLSYYGGHINEVRGWSRAAQAWADREKPLTSFICP